MIIIRGGHYETNAYCEKRGNPKGGNQKGGTMRNETVSRKPKKSAEDKKWARLSGDRIAKEKGGRFRITVPTIGIWPNHIYLNRHAMEIIGKKRGVVLFYNAKEKRLSLWFFTEIKQSKDPKNTFSVTRYKDGTGRITAGKWLQQYDLYSLYSKSKKIVIYLKQDREVDDLFYATF